MKVKIVFDQATDNPQRFEDRLNKELEQLGNKVIDVDVSISRDGVHNSATGVIKHRE